MPAPDHRPISLPPKVESAPIQEAAEEYRRLVAEHAEARDRRARLEEERQGAVDADRRAYAEAIRAGKADPGTPKTEAADQAILAARRREEAQAEAVTLAYSDLTAAVEKHRATLARTLEQRVAKSRSEVGKSIGDLEEALTGLSEALASAAWLENFPTGRWAPAKHGMVMRPLVRNQEPARVEQVLEALRELANPPEPRTRFAQPNAQPLRTVPRAA